MVAMGTVQILDERTVLSDSEQLAEALRKVPDVPFMM
jgi:hypothetical protein